MKHCGQRISPSTGTETDNVETSKLSESLSNHEDQPNTGGIHFILPKVQIMSFHDTSNSYKQFSQFREI